MKVAYRQVGDSVEKRIIHGEEHKRSPRGVPPDNRHMSETVLKAYYQLECQHGSRFRSAYTKNQIKRVHERALEKFDQTGIET